jgi:hypothetical protein
MAILLTSCGSLTFYCREQAGLRNVSATKVSSQSHYTLVDCKSVRKHARGFHTRQISNNVQPYTATSDELIDGLLARVTACIELFDGDIARRLFTPFTIQQRR